MGYAGKLEIKEFDHMKSTLSMVSVKNWFEQTRQFRSTCNAHDFLPPNFEFAYTGRNNVYFPSESFVLFFTFFPNSGTRNVPGANTFGFGCIWNQSTRFQIANKYLVHTKHTFFLFVLENNFWHRFSRWPQFLQVFKVWNLENITHNNWDQNLENLPFSRLMDSIK